VEGIIEKLDVIDERILPFLSKDWKWSRISPVDKSVLRLATYELLFVDNVPPLVAINEAIELIKTFAAPESRAFINAVLNSIDRLEVRGRDSAGISIMFIMDQAEFESLEDTLDKANFMDQLRSRTGKETLVNGSITIRKEIDNNGAKKVSLLFCYKVAAEIGSLGDNVAFLRAQIKEDRILQAAVNFPHLYFTVLSHTRWASVGAISEPNCHPVDNITAHNDYKNTGIFHVVLNGDIDNYLELKERYESAYGVIPKNITTDTKIIPLQIESYIHKGHGLTEAFRLAVNDFKGSHAIVMHTDMAPGKL